MNMIEYFISNKLYNPFELIKTYENCGSDFAKLLFLLSMSLFIGILIIVISKTINYELAPSPTILLNFINIVVFLSSVIGVLALTYFISIIPSMVYLYNLFYNQTQFYFAIVVAIYTVTTLFIWAYYKTPKE